MNSKECKEFINALEAICKEKQISEEVIFEGMTQALSKAYAKETNLPNIRIDINKKTGEIKGYSYQKVVSEYTDGEEDEAGEETVEILLEDAKKIVPDITVGETIEEEVPLKDFGRVATQAAKQILVQKVREAERQSIMADDDIIILKPLTDHLRICSNG